MIIRAPGKVGKYSLDLFIKSDSYIGLDHQLKVQFEVKSASNLPKYEPHPEDVALDEDPTLFEQIMSGQTKDDTSSDEENDDESDNENDKNEKKLNNTSNKNEKIRQRKINKSNSNSNSDLDSDSDSDIEEITIDEINTNKNL